MSRRVMVAVDAVVLTLRDEQLQVLLVQRGTQPQAGVLALPGGFFEDDKDEDLDATVARELAEETRLDARQLSLARFSVYSARNRDPRERVLSVAYVALLPDLPEPAAGGDAADALWTPVDRAVDTPLAFDHTRILGDAIDYVQRQFEDTPLGAAFCGDEFTISDLRRVYELVWGRELDARNFSRKVTSAEGLLVDTGAYRHSSGRPAKVYRRGPATRMHPPILRAGVAPLPTR